MPRKMPKGQPYAYPLKKLFMYKGRQHVKFIYPHDVVRVGSKVVLEDSLKHYSHPIPSLSGCEHSIKSKYNYLHTLMYVRPALRWYCKVYGVKVPSWLEGNGWASGMSEDTLDEYLGVRELDVKEFKEDKQLAGKRS